MELSAYAVVIPKAVPCHGPSATWTEGAETFDRTLAFAAEEFSLFFGEATGVRLPVMYDFERKEGPFVSIGQTAQLAASGFVLDGDPDDEGVAVFSKDGNLYIAGGADESAGFGVYVCLERLFGLEIFAADCWTIDKKPDFRFEDFSFSEKPYIAHRKFSTYHCDRIESPLEYVQRFRLGNMWRLWATFGHTFCCMFPPSEYFDAHPEWYSTFNNEGKRPPSDEAWQACVTNPAFIEAYAKRIEEILLERRCATYVSLSQNDGGQEPCKCPRCLEAYRRLGESWCGVYIEFANKVAGLVGAWAKEAIPDRAGRLRFSLLGYGLTDSPPLDGAGNPLVTCADNLSVQYAPIVGNRATAYTDGTQYEIFHSPEYGAWETGNRKCAAALARWRKVSRSIDYWSYGVDYCDFLSPHNCWNTMKANIIDCKRLGGRLFYEEATHNARTADFSEMKLYVESRLMWNINLDINRLIGSFMRAYYGERGAGKVRAYFDSLQALFEKKPLDYGKIADTHGGAVDEAHFPLEFLLDGYMTLEEAARLADADSDPQRAFYRDNIKTEQLCPAHLLLEIYPDRLDRPFREKLVGEFVLYGEKKGLGYLGALNGDFKDLVKKYRALL